MEISRRAILAGGGALLMGGAPTARAKTKLKVAIFSKHLQFLQGEDLAKATAGIGFDGIDLAVRKGGHVEPATVAKDLPELVGILRKNGLEVPMITTDIADVETPYAEDLLKSASSLGIRYYRSGGFKWEQGKPYPAQMEVMKAKLAKLAALNAKYNTCAMYHTHSGVGLVGASIWDLWYMMKDLDPKLMGINYDVGHATIEGGTGGWIASFKVAGNHVRGIAVKDFIWEKGPNGAWKSQWKPIGEGMVKMPQFLAMVAETDFAGPFQMHFEYPLGGAEGGKRTVSIPKEEVLGAMKRDLTKVRGMLAQAGL